MKTLFAFSLLVLVSCSGGGDSKGQISSSGLSASQTQAKALIDQDIQHLRSNQYRISDSDLNILRKEGLITEAQLNSLSIVK